MSTTQDSPYQNTLNLPHDVLPIRANLPAKEPDILHHWQTIGVYQLLRERAANAVNATNAVAAKTKIARPSFILHDGPPYANGHLHIGHALNKVLKDLVARSQQMMGFDSRYIPGWDCHGLPIEWKVEEDYRARGIKKDDVPIIELRQKCRTFADRWVAIQAQEFQRLGVTGQWNTPFLTMDYQSESIIVAEFHKFVMNRSLYQGSKPVMWSPVEQTALAEAEVEYHDHTSQAIWVRFPVTQENNLSVLIWTTTPWTIPSNRAVCYNQDLSYGVYCVSAAPDDNWLTQGARIMIADKTANTIAKATRTALERTADAPAQYLEACQLQHPLFHANTEWQFTVPMYHADHVADDAGTGFVHTAPSHGVDDYRVFLSRGRLSDITDNVRADGTFRPDLPLFAGAAILTPKGKPGDADKRVIAALQEQRTLAAHQRFQHSYPHSWRSKAPLIYLNRPQWFVDIDMPLNDGMDTYGKSIRARAMHSIDHLVQFTPKAGQNRLGAMMKDRPDWLLSRQRVWGVPLACFTRVGVDQKDKEAYLMRDKNVNARIADAFLKEGADVWYQAGAKERFLDGLYNPDEWCQVNDILDVWFDSGSTHAFVLKGIEGGRDGFADLYLEGTDQHRGWFHASLLQASATKGRAPYKGVLTHGFTLDAKGNKMSKSLGNTVAPEQIIKMYGADILRLWVAQSNYASDLRIGDEILKGVRDTYRKLRNTLRFVLGNSIGFKLSDTIPYADLPALERYILHILAEADTSIRADYAAYNFQAVTQKIFHIVAFDLSSFYFDVRKDILYCALPNSPMRIAVQSVLYHIFHVVARWLAPIIPFTTDDVWMHHPLYNDTNAGMERSVHLHDFLDIPPEWHDPSLSADWEKIRRIRSFVIAALEPQRAEGTIGSALEACPVVYIADDHVRRLCTDVRLADLCLTSGAYISADPVPQSAFVLEDTPGVGVVFALAEGEKCPRCWKITRQAAADGLCKRCQDVVGLL